MEKSFSNFEESECVANEEDWDRDDTSENQRGESLPLDHFTPERKRTLVG